MDDTVGSQTLKTRDDKTENVGKGVFGVKEVMILKRSIFCGRVPRPRGGGTDRWCVDVESSRKIRRRQLVLGRRIS